MAFQHSPPPVLWNVQVEVGGAWTTLEAGRRVGTREAYRLMLRHRLESSGRIRMVPADVRVAGEYPAVNV